MLCNIWIPIKSQNWLKCTQNSHKCPRKRPPNAHKNAFKCTQRRSKNAHTNTYTQLIHHNNKVTLMCRYLKSCTTRLFSRQLCHGSWRPLLVLCMWIQHRNLSIAIALIYFARLMLTWLLPRLFSTSGRLAAILACWWHSRSTGDE